MITIANTGLRVLSVSQYFSPAQSTDQIQNAIKAEYMKSIYEMGFQYEDVHVQITFVDRVVVKETATHFTIENTWASYKTLLWLMREQTPVTNFEQVHHPL